MDQQENRARAPTMPVEVNLTAAIVAVAHDEPMILVAGADSAGQATLPSGPFDPLAHRTFEMGLRAWVNEQADVRLGYVEQLYTFGDRGRQAQADDRDPHVVSVGYLALTQLGDAESGLEIAQFRRWYSFFPWEDRRAKKPAMIEAKILPALAKWSARDPDTPNSYGLTRTERVRILFGQDAPFADESAAPDGSALRRPGAMSSPHVSSKRRSTGAAPHAA